MKHLRVATYEIKKGSFQELADESRKGMLRVPGAARIRPLRRRGRRPQHARVAQPVGTRKDAEASAPIAGTWVREHVSDRVELRSSEIGDLAFYEGAPAEGLTDRILRANGRGGRPPTHP